MGGYVFASVGRYIGMFVNNFLAPIQVRLSPNLVSHTLGHKDEVIKEGQGQRSRSVREVCALLSPSI